MVRNPRIEEVYRLMSIGDRVRRLRLEQGLNASELARRAKLPPATVTRVEQGKTESPTAATVEKLARGLGVTPGELFIPEESVEELKFPKELTPQSAKNWFEALQNRGVLILSVTNDETGESLALEDFGEEEIVQLAKSLGRTDLQPGDAIQLLIRTVPVESSEPIWTRIGATATGVFNMRSYTQPSEG